MSGVPVDAPLVVVVPKETDAGLDISREFTFSLLSLSFHPISKQKKSHASIVSRVCVGVKEVKDSLKSSSSSS